MDTLRVVGLWMLMAFALLGGFGSRNSFARQTARLEQGAEKLPSDVHLETLSRMPQARRDQFTADDDKQAYDHLVEAEPRYAQPSNGALAATGTRLHIPVVADAYRTALQYLRSKSGVDPKYQELAVMVATREVDGEEPWTSHEEGAVKLNSRKIIEIIRNKQEAKGFGEKEDLIIQFGREMFRQSRVSSKTFADMERLFGRKGTLAIVLLMGHYAENALLYRAYDQHMDASLKRPFPDVLAKEAKEKNK
jgi:hypothetical protein